MPCCSAHVVACMEAAHNALEDSYMGEAVGMPLQGLQRGLLLGIEPHYIPMAVPKTSWPMVFFEVHRLVKDHGPMTQRIKSKKGKIDEALGIKEPKGIW